jgi:hypothetical protein
VVEVERWTPGESGPFRCASKLADYLIALSPALGTPKRQGCGVVPRNLSAFGRNIWHHSQQHKSVRT